MKRNQLGFTLIELAIALSIVAVIIGITLKGQSMIDMSRMQAAIQVTNDLDAGVKEFKARYKLLPGDLINPPVDNLIAACIPGGNANGVIDGAAGIFAGVTTEAQCVPEILTKANIIKSDELQNGFPVVLTYYGRVWVKNTAGSQAVMSKAANPYTPSIRHVIELENLSCEAVNYIETKIDDNNFDTGRVIASVANCTGGGVNDPVPFVAISVR